MNMKSSSSIDLPDIFNPDDSVSSHGRPGGRVFGGAGRSHPSSVKSAGPLRNLSLQTFFRLMALTVVCTTTFALYYINSGVIRNTTPKASLDRGDIARKVLKNPAATNKPTDRIALPLNHPSGMQNTSPAKLTSGVQNISPAKLPSGVQNIPPVNIPSGVQNISPVKLPSGAQNTSPAKIPGGVQNISPAKIPSGVQNISPAKLPSGVQNTSPVKLPSGVQNISPAKLPSGVQNTYPGGVQNASPAKIPTGVQNTSPAKLPSGVQNTYPGEVQNASPAKIPSGVQNASPAKLPSGVQNTYPGGVQNASPAKIPTGVQNTSPAKNPSGVQNISPAKLPSGGQNTSPANPSGGAKATQLLGDSRKTCPELKNIPNLSGAAKELHLEETPMNTVESQVFGNMRDKILHLVEEGNRQMRASSLQTPSTGGTGSYDRLLGSLIPFEAMLDNYSYLPGGHWRPMHCTPRWKVAIIIPYRHREYHLPILIRHLVPMLQKQLLQFAIYSVNQENNMPFNRAMLMNVGFLESLKFSDWDCFVLHDVDHVPLSDLNDYGCTNMPKRMLSGSDRWNYRIPYHNFFGAVTGMTRENIRTINGFPNVYWGWGGEDDEIFERVRARNLNVYRTTGPENYYKVIKHHHMSSPAMKERFNLLRSFRSRYQHDGLNNIRYTRPLIELHTLYTNISVNIQKV